MPDYNSEALTLKHISLSFVSEYQHCVFINPSTCVTDLHICIEAWHNHSGSHDERNGVKIILVVAGGSSYGF